MSLIYTRPPHNSQQIILSNVQSRFFTYIPTVAKRITGRAEVAKLTYWQRRLQKNYCGEEIKTRART